MRITPASLALLAVCFVTGAASAANPTYWQDVRPIFRKHCTVRHTARHLSEPGLSGGLALDSDAAAMKWKDNYSLCRRAAT